MPSIRFPSLHHYSQRKNMMSKLPVSARLGIGFGAAVVLGALIGLLGFVTSTRLTGEIRTVYAEGVLAGQHLAAAQNALWELRYGVSQYIAVAGPESRRKIVAESPRWFATMDTSLAAYAKGNLSPEAQSALAEFNEVYAQYREKRPIWFEMMDAGRIDEAAAFRARTIYMTGGDMVIAMKKMIDVHTRDSKKVEEAAEMLAANAKIGIIAIVLLVSVGGILTSIWIVRDLARQLGGEPGYAADMARLIAHGDLMTEIHTRQGDSTSLLASMKHMQSTLCALISAIQQTAERLASEADKVAMVSNMTSQGVMEQRQETDSAGRMVLQITEFLVESAARASEAATAAQVVGNEVGTMKSVVASSAEAIQGLANQVQNAATVIQSLEKESLEIDSVTRLIREITEQTNLLSLNAAIEAARAGEQGRGFAVVADEVRKLAQRTREATHDITRRIDQLQSEARNARDVIVAGTEQANATVRQVSNSNDSIGRIVEAVATILEDNDAIATSLEAKKNLAQQVGHTLATVSQVAEQTTYSSSQTSREITAVSHEAQNLRDMVAQFRVPGIGTAAAPEQTAQASTDDNVTLF
jgi:methyl-accepting chemotaxis protein